MGEEPSSFQRDRPWHYNDLGRNWTRSLEPVPSRSSRGFLEQPLLFLTSPSPPFITRPKHAGLSLPCSVAVPAGKSEEERERPTSRGADQEEEEEEEGKISSSEGLRSLLDVFEERSPGVHHGFEGVFAAGSHALVGVEQHGQLPVGFVHLVPRRYSNNSEGYKATDNPEQPCFG